MATIFRTELPDDVDPDVVQRDLESLAEGVATIELRPAARSGQGGKLGQVDSSIWEIVVHLLDTQAAAAAVHSVLGGVGGYILAKTGKKPASEDRPDRKTEG